MNAAWLDYCARHGGRPVAARPRGPAVGHRRRGCLPRLGRQSLDHRAAPRHLRRCAAVTPAPRANRPGARSPVRLRRPGGDQFRTVRTHRPSTRCGDPRRPRLSPAPCLGGDAPDRLRRLQRLAGAATDVVGRRRLLVAGTVVFTTVSIGARSPPTRCTWWRVGSSRNSGGMVLPAALALVDRYLSRGTQPQEGHRDIQWHGGSGSSGRLVLGGVLTTAAWQWIFLINAPVGIVVVIFGLSCCPRQRPSDRAGSTPSARSRSRRAGAAHRWRCCAVAPRGGPQR